MRHNVSTRAASGIGNALLDADPTRSDMNPTPMHQSRCRDNKGVQLAMAMTANTLAHATGIAGSACGRAWAFDFDPPLFQRNRFDGLDGMGKVQL